MFEVERDLGESRVVPGYVTRKTCFPKQPIYIGQTAYEDMRHRVDHRPSACESRHRSHSHETDGGFDSVHDPGDFRSIARMREFYSRIRMPSDRSELEDLVSFLVIDPKPSGGPSQAVVTPGNAVQQVVGI